MKVLERNIDQTSIDTSDSNKFGTNMHNPTAHGTRRRLANNLSPLGAKLETQISDRTTGRVQLSSAVLNLCLLGSRLETEGPKAAMFQIHGPPSASTKRC